jgi:hypothetical protein
MLELHPKRLDNEPRNCSSGVSLLPRDEIFIAHSMSFESSRDDETGVLKLLCFVFDPKRLDAHANKFVREFLFRVCEAEDPCLPVNDQISIDHRFEQNASRMTQDSRDLSGFEARRRQAMNPLVFIKGVHRSLAANKQNGRIAWHIGPDDWHRVFD